MTFCYLLHGVIYLFIHQGINVFLSSVVPDGLQVGLVQFSDIATRLSALQTIMDNSRRTLIGLIPGFATGGTDIGEGQ